MEGGGLKAEYKQIDFFTPYLQPLLYEGVLLERNRDQTLGVLQSPMKEYSIRLGQRPMVKKLAFFEKTHQNHIG